jgi:hypothetical protein
LLVKHAKNIQVLSGQVKSKITSAKRDSPWREDPLPLAEFVRSDRHISSYGRKIELWDAQREDLEAFLGLDPKQLFEDGDRKQQAFLVYGKGSGKDFIVALVQCWITHILLCLYDPQDYLGLAPDESIDIPVIGYSQKQSKDVYFAKFKQRILHWQWLRETIDKLEPQVGGDRWLRESGKYVGTESVKLPFHINCWSLTASLGNAEGKNIIFWVLDELAAFTSENKVNFAKEMHSLVVSSARTRFNKRWRGVAISFPRHKGDYVMQTANKVEKGIIQDTFLSIRATWDVRPGITKADFADDYARDPEGSAAKYECKPPAQVDAYYRSPELLLLHSSGAPYSLLRQHLDLSDSQLEAIAALGQSPITEVDNYGDPILDLRGFPKLASWFRGQKNPNGDLCEYYCHIDLGLKADSAGLAIGHIHSLPNGQQQPVLDLAFRWTAGMFRDFGEIYRPAWFSDTKEQREIVTAAEIDIRTIREFIFFLKYARNFNVVLATYDAWNSAESIQELRRRDIPVGVHLVTKADYDEFKALVYDRRLRYYGFPILIEESFKLQVINGSKVDAPRTSEGDGEQSDSHKDVSDAAAAVIARLARMKDDAIEFFQMEPIDSVWDKAEKRGEAVRVEMTPDRYNEVQQKILQTFFDE